MKFFGTTTCASLALTCKFASEILDGLFFARGTALAAAIEAICMRRARRLGNIICSLSRLSSPYLCFRQAATWSRPLHLDPYIASSDMQWGRLDFQGRQVGIREVQRCNGYIL